MAPTPPGGPHSVIYVRVSPQVKQQLRELADSRFDGNLSEAIRWLVNAQVRLLQMRQITPDGNVVGLDELPSPPPDE